MSLWSAAVDGAYVRLPAEFMAEAKELIEASKPGDFEVGEN
jgi:hypothetical protein